MKHLLYCPFTGLGLHNGFRGNEWLKNRIQIFKQFVVPSLKAQTNQNFILWISWRREEKNNPIVKEFIEWLNQKPLYAFGPLEGIEIVNTFNGVCFYDDKYPPEIARERLISSVHGSMQSLVNVIGECDYVLMTIQPSDDLYHKDAVKSIQKVLEGDRFDAVGFKNGYICNYNTLQVAEYNPTTNPPFYTIKFPRAMFIDPVKHVEFTSLKRNTAAYKVGTPLPSHEYPVDVWGRRYAIIDDLRGFMVGTHGQNISTTFDIPFKGKEITNLSVPNDFGIIESGPLQIKLSFWKKILLKFPYRVQRKIRYITLEWKFFKLSTWSGLIK